MGPAGGCARRRPPGSRAGRGRQRAAQQQARFVARAVDARSARRAADSAGGGAVAVPRSRIRRRSQGLRSSLPGLVVVPLGVADVSPEALVVGPGVVAVPGASSGLVWWPCSGAGGRAWRGRRAPVWWPCRRVAWSVPCRRSVRRGCAPGAWRGRRARVWWPCRVWWPGSRSAAEPGSCRGAGAWRTRCSVSSTLSCTESILSWYRPPVALSTPSAVASAALPASSAARSR